MVWNNFSSVKPTPIKGQGKGGGGGGGGSWKGDGGGDGNWQKKQWNKPDDSDLNAALIKALLSQGGGNGGGKGRGKGWRKGVDPFKTVWVGNIPDGCTYQDLLMHAKQCGNAKWAEVYKHKGSGTGAVGFGSAEEATQAIMALNGSMLGTTVIQCDAWARELKK
eukprot:TRINITY_DN141_c0_g1_i3.p1 TRINITY_DN141_c0_g1~~TRINITY_DN141_c0_g1_i3.p1  ORF type:complete len:182 (-),score=35.49 TRINITY_DN141_c0_g1_i3:89-580(-)